MKKEIIYTLRERKVLKKMKYRFVLDKKKKQIKIYQKKTGLIKTLDYEEKYLAEMAYIFKKSNSVLVEGDVVDGNLKITKVYR